MRQTFLASTALTMLIAAPALSQSTTDRVVEQLSNKGFQTVEVKNGPTQTKVEAVRGNTQIEVVFDRTTGAVVKQETEPFNGQVTPDQMVEVKSEDRDFVNRSRNRSDDDDDDDRDDDRDDDHDDDRDDDSDDDQGRDRDRNRDRDDDHDDDHDDDGHGGRGDDGDGDNDSSGHGSGGDDSDSDGDGDSDSGDD